MMENDEDQESSLLSETMKKQTSQMLETYQSRSNRLGADGERRMLGAAESIAHSSLTSNK